MLATIKEVFYMATQITNQATLNFKSGTADRSIASNIASVTLQGPMSISKRTLESAYQLNQILTYTIVFENTAASQLTNVVIEDDLGSYALAGGTIVTPLDYVGPSNQYINNAYVSSTEPTVTAGKITYTFPVVNAGAKLLIQYKVRTNEYAKGIVGTSTIQNTVTTTANGIASSVTATHSILLDSYADVTIEKTMSPNPVTDGDTLTYTFVMKNYGTAAATNVSLKDTFVTPPSNLTVTLDGATVPVTNYDYTESTGEFLFPGAASGYSFSIDAATITQDPTTGIVTVTPKERTLVITGTI